MSPTPPVRSLTELLERCKSDAERLDLVEHALRTIHPDINLGEIESQIREMIELDDSGLHPFDPFGFLIAWTFQTQLWKSIPANERLDLNRLGHLHQLAVQIVDLAVPWAWPFIQHFVRLDPPLDHAPTSARLHQVYAAWLTNTFLPALSKPSELIDRKVPKERVTMLNNLWRLLLTFSAIKFDPRTLAAAAATAVHRDDDNDRPVDLPPDTGRAALELIAQLFGASFHHLAVGRTRVFILNARGVRDRLNAVLGQARRRTPSRTTGFTDPDPAAGPAGPTDHPTMVEEIAATQAAIEDLAALREFGAMRDADPVGRCASFVARSVEPYDDPNRAHSAAVALTGFVAISRATRDPVTQAAVAYELLGSWFTRAEIAATFGLSTSQIVRAEAKAHELIARCAPRVA